jgi:2'-5' RNA ligase
MRTVHEVIAAMPDDFGIEPREIVRAALFQTREKLLDDFGLKKDDKENYIIPDTGWTEHYYNLYDRANYLAFIKHFKPWVKSSPHGTEEGAVILHRSLFFMPTSKIKELLDAITDIKDNYPVLDEEILSDLEVELSEEAWGSTYRKEFKKLVKDAVSPFFEDITPEEGASPWEMVEDLLDGDEGDGILDDFFRYYQEHSNGDDWEFEDSGGVRLRLKKVEQDIYNSDLGVKWARELKNKLWPEDPRQLKFKFAECIVGHLLAGCVTLIESSGAARIMAAQLMEDSGPHEYSCVMIDLPPDMSAKIIAWGRQQIPNEQLFVDKDGGSGREEEIHVTVKYGLHDAMPNEALKKIFGSTAPFEIELAPISLFRNEGHDVVKMEVSSPQLRELNRVITASCDCTDSYPEYKPHVTLAYVRPGTCDRLEGTSPFDNPIKMGATTLRKEGHFTANQVVFSSRTGIKKSYSLGPEEPEKEQVEEDDSAGESTPGIDPAEIARPFIRGKEVSLKNLRLAASRELIRSIHVNRRGVGSYPEGRLTFFFMRGANRYVDFCSLGVLAQALREWRNLKGVPLFVDNATAGVVSYQNPVLAALAR